MLSEANSKYNYRIIRTKKYKVQVQLIWDLHVIYTMLPVFIIFSSLVIENIVNISVCVYIYTYIM